MEYYSNSDKFDMVTCYILSHRNGVDAQRMYLNQYPERRQPGSTLFRRLVANLKEYGAFVKPIEKRQRQANEENENTVLEAVVENPNISTRQIENDTGIPKSTAHLVLQKHHFHPYKHHVCQSLREGDNERRRIFCEWYTRESDNNTNFPFKILWSDESRFTNNGLFNRNNFHHWASENPHLKRESRHQVRFGFNVWCGILGRRLIGPIIFDNSLTSNTYLQLLQNDVEDILDNLPLEESNNCWFHQDGAPPHNSRIVANYLNERFGNRWIGTHGNVPWPARSPDLTPMDFFLWGYIKNQVYKQTYNNVDDLRNAVLQAFQNIPPRTLLKAVESVTRRCYLCLENDGNLFEQLL